MPVDLDDLKHKLQALGPAPWRHANGLAIDYGYVDAQGKYTILMGERGEGAVDEDNPEGIALVALRNAADDLIAELEALRAAMRAR